MKRNKKKLAPIQIHPGEILKEELDYLGINQAELACDINVSTRRINEICQEKHGISIDTSLRLGIYFKMGEKGSEFWINLQQKYERECLRDILVSQEKIISGQIRPLTREKLVRKNVWCKVTIDHNLNQIRKKEILIKNYLYLK